MSIAGDAENAPLSPTAQPIQVPYVLALFTTSVHEVDGVRYLDELWARDLREHARYITDLTVVSYLEHELPAEKPVRVDTCPVLSRIRFVCVAKPRNMLHGVTLLPGFLRALWTATRGARVVHSEIAGWPFPTAWLLLPVGLVRSFLTVIVVESAFWRVLAKDTPTRRAWRALSERFNALCVRRTDLCLYTHAGYRKSLGDARESLITPASWVRDADIISDAQAAELVQERLAAKRLRLVFAGRLTEEKGVASVIRAMKQRTQGAPVDLDIYGWGPLEESIRAAEVNLPALRIRFMGMVDYGAPFFRTLSRYDALILPTLTDEQPRVLFDAYSQGLPAIVSATAGIRDYHQDGKHGTTFTPGNEQEIVSAVERFSNMRGQWRELTKNCIQAGRNLTHERMHSVRAEAINRLLHREAS